MEFGRKGKSRRIVPNRPLDGKLDPTHTKTLEEHGEVPLEDGPVRFDVLPAEDVPGY
jgi:hypothetical protein